MVEISKNTADSRKNDPSSLELMQKAAKGQAPRFLLISPINRSAQDLQLFGLNQGEAFQGTRVSNHPLLIPEKSPMLYAGPAAYNSHFPEKDGVLITFEDNEPDEIVNKTLISLSSQPDLHGIPFLAFRTNYENGSVKIIEHTFTRNKEAEQNILTKIAKPEPVDKDVIVVICSDSRVHPPRTPKGQAMAIQTLGGYISQFSGEDDETQQLNLFLVEWLKGDVDSKSIFLIVHGKTETEGQHCGAGAASLAPHDVHGDYLKPVIEKLATEALSYESTPTESPEVRVISIAQSVKHNLSTYPAVKAAIGRGLKLDTLIQIGMIDTVSGLISEV